jgi:simple sugar transport system permease protein
MSLIFAVIFLQVMLFRSRWGLRTRAVGEHPKAADTVGIDVIRTRYRNVILGGVFAGLGGAYLTMESVGSFQDNMTAGIGFIAIAAMIFGRWTPVGAFIGALLFGAARTLGQAVQIDPPPGAIGEWIASWPAQIFGMFPYILTIIILAGVVGRAIPPAADGIPYDKEARG